MCGEKTIDREISSLTRGSPPRVRGKGQGFQVCKVARGITPAYAGKRIKLRKRHSICGDHPRACGEKFKICKNKKTHVGSPPRVRGKETAGRYTGRYSGIIPAYAGKSSAAAAARICARDHPRVCGEKWWITVPSTPPWGSPPRVRGKVPDPCIPTWQEGITPAYAGKSRCCFR